MNDSFEKTALEQLELALARDEKSEATKKKYRRDVRAFLRFIGETGQITKESVLAYKKACRSATPSAAPTPCWRR